MWPILLLVGLGQGLQRGQGVYQPFWLLTLLLVLPWMCGLRLWRRGVVSEDWLLKGYLLQSSLFLLGQGFWFQQHHGAVGSAIAINFACALWAARVWPGQPERALKIGVAALLLARWLVPLESPHPGIDVFTIGTEGADRWLAGINPYAQEYPDIYAGKSGYRAIYLYWPSVIWLQGFSRWALGEIRYSFVFCDALVVYLVYNWFPHQSSKRRLLWCLFWLSCPASLVMLENAWVDTYLLFFLVCALSAWQRRHPLLLGLACGGLLATKQYAPCYAVLLWPAIAARWPARQTVQATLTAGLTALALFLPFWLNDWGAFDRNTIRAVGDLPMRKDGLTLQAFLLNEWGWVFPSWLMPSAYLLSLGALSIYVWRRPQARSCWAALACFMTIFCLLGKQAFLNYYYLLWFFIWAVHYHDSLEQPA